MVFVITGSRKDYAWGVVDGLAPWTGVRDGATQAELWFGVHPSGPAPLLNAPGVLSEHLDERQAPLLVKLLAAAQPLSIQVHPDTQLAAATWQEQQTPGAPQIYPDPYEKTEMLVALTEFTAFAGWRDTRAVLDLLERIPGTGAAGAALRHGDRAAAIRALLDIHPVGPAVTSVRQAFATAPGHEIDAVDAAVRYFPQDPGVLLLPLLAVAQLAPGDALYVPAGVPHSYVRGVGLEVMTSSDNVVRLGLTPKEVRIEQALAALKADRSPLLLPAAATLHPPGAPFSVTLLRAEDQVLPTGSYRLVIAIEGEAQVRLGDGSSAGPPLHGGTALVAAADDPDLQVHATGLTALVRHQAAA